MIKRKMLFYIGIIIALQIVWGAVAFPHAAYEVANAISGKMARVLSPIMLFSPFSKSSDSYLMSLEPCNYALTACKAALREVFSPRVAASRIIKEKIKKIFNITALNKNASPLTNKAISKKQSKKKKRTPILTDPVTGGQSESYSYNTTNPDYGNDFNYGPNGMVAVQKLDPKNPNQTTGSSKYTTSTINGNSMALGNTAGTQTSIPMDTICIGDLPSNTENPEEPGEPPETENPEIQFSSGSNVSPSQLVTGAGMNLAQFYFTNTSFECADPSYIQNSKSDNLVNEILIGSGATQQPLQSSAPRLPALQVATPPPADDPPPPPVGGNDAGDDGKDGGGGGRFLLK